ncbi:MAG: hypothetical protein FJ291_29545 [Planctomycetes bacterium]|nr:hypothetical protein [Planctomycetota bacterium]
MSGPRTIAGLTLLALAGLARAPALSAAELKRYVYSVQPDGSQAIGPGGGKGIVVIDIDKGFRFVKRMTTPASEKLVHAYRNGRGMYGIAAARATGRLYYCWHQGRGKGDDGVGCLDLLTDKVVWERNYEFSCARIQVSVDAKSVFVARHWEDPGTRKLYVLDAANGDVVREYDCGKRWPQHPLVVHPDGKRLFFPGAALDLESGRILWTDDKVCGRGNCHIVLNRDGTRLYTGRHPEQATVATWILDADSGQVVHKVPLDTAGCPDLKGGVTEVVAFSPDGSRFWGEASGERFLLQFDNAAEPPKLIRVVDKQDLVAKHGYKPLGHGHGHAMVSGAGDYVWFSNGIVLDADSGAYVCQWTAEEGKPFQSAKMLEVDLLDGKVLWTGQDQGHGFIYSNYPIERVRALRPNRNAAGRQGTPP